MEKKEINTLQHRGKYLLYLQLMVDTRRQSIANTPSPIPTETHVVSAHSKSLFKQFLLLNRWTDFEIISQEDSLGNSLLQLLKLFCAIEQDGCQS